MTVRYILGQALRTLCLVAVLSFKFFFFKYWPEDFVFVLFNESLAVQRDPRPCARECLTAFVFWEFFGVLGIFFFNFFIFLMNRYF